MSNPDHSNRENPMKEVVIINPHIWKLSKLSREEFIRRLKCVRGIRTGFKQSYDYFPSLSYFPDTLESWTHLERFHRLVNEGDFSIFDELPPNQVVFTIVLPEKLTTWLLNVKLATLQHQILNWLAAWKVFHGTWREKKGTSIPRPIEERVETIIANYYGAGFSSKEMWEKGYPERPNELLTHYCEVSKSLTGSVPPEILKLRVCDLDGVDLDEWGLEAGCFGTWPSLRFPYRYGFMYARDWDAIVVRGERDEFERDAVELWEKWKHTFSLYPTSKNHLFELAKQAPQSGYIYLFRAKESGRYKVGWTADEDPYARKGSLQTGSAEELIPAGHFRAASNKTETTVHIFFEGKRVRSDGEWFGLNEADVSCLLDGAWRARNNIF